MELHEIRRFVRDLIKEGLEDEKSLNNLTTLMLKYIAEELFKKQRSKIYTQTESDGKKRFVLYEGDFNFYKGVLDLSSLPEVFQRWIEENNISVYLTSSEKKMTDSTTSKGWYVRPHSIFLVYEMDDLLDIYLMLNGKYMLFDKPMEPKSDDIYFKLYYKFHDTLLHELRHAYDDYRSGGKYLNSKRWNKFQNKFVNYSKEEKTLEKDADMFLSYWRLPHEINARMTQAINKIHFDKFKDNSYTEAYKKPFDEVYKDFKYRFEGWKQLTDIMKKNITKRLYKYWSDYKVPEL